MDQNIETAMNAAIDYVGVTAPLVVSTYFSNDPNIAIAATAAGGGLAALIKMMFADVVRRALSRRETVKIGSAMFYAIEKINTYLKNGYSPQYADLSASIDTRSGINEILEGILLKSSKEHEEKKLKILGNIFANTCFLEGTTFRDANLAINLVNNMTYTKLCILSLFAKKFRMPERTLLDTNFVERFKNPLESNIFNDLLLLLFEIKNLFDNNLINQAENNQENSTISSDEIISEGYPSVLGLYEIIPSNLRLTSLGKKIALILSLEDIPDSDISSLYILLSEPSQVTR